jgi:hypothetical protein
MFYKNMALTIVMLKSCDLMVKWGSKIFPFNVEVRGSNLDTCNLVN